MSVDETAPVAREHVIPSLRAATSDAAAAAAPRIAVGTVGTQRFRRYVLIVVGVFGFLYALQSVRQFSLDLPSLGGPFAASTIVLIWASVLGGPVAAFVPRHADRILWIAVAAYALGLALLPFGIMRPILADHLPWIVAVSATPLAYLALASKSMLRTMVIDLVFAVDIALVLDTAGRMRTAVAVVDALLVVMLAVVLTLVIAALRSGVRRADVAQAALLAAYAADQAEGATEAERRRTDALLHDAVLTTFLSAAAAQTPEAEELAGRMAANAVQILSHVNRSTEYGDTTSFAEAWADVRPRLLPILSRFAVQTDGAETVILPAVIADAMLEAMAEAMTNSVRHADAEHRELRIAPLGPDGLRIVVRDDGLGFDPTAVRMGGISTFVQQPLRRFYGRADIDTAPGRGCTVVLSWGSIVMSDTDPRSDDSLVTA